MTYDNFLHDNSKMSDFIKLTKECFLEFYSYLTEEEYEKTHKKHPNYEDIKEEMETYNADEVGIDDPISMEEAEYNLLNSDRFYYND